MISDLSMQFQSLVYIKHQVSHGLDSTVTITVTKITL